MAASTTQVILTAVGVLTITVVPFVWGLYRMVKHTREHEPGEDERVM
ncbi:MULTISPECIES: hypothetical protein [Halostella]|nr:MULTISPECIES: hypothetical protein [Halostella]